MDRFRCYREILVPIVYLFLQASFRQKVPHITIWLTEGKYISAYAWSDVRRNGYYVVLKNANGGQIPRSLHIYNWGYFGGPEKSFSEGQIIGNKKRGPGKRHRKTQDWW